MQNARVLGANGVSSGVWNFCRVTIGLLVMACLAPLAAAHELRINGAMIAPISTPPRAQILDDIKAQIDETKGLEARAEILRIALDGLWLEGDKDLFVKLLFDYRTAIANLAHGSLESIGHKFELAGFYSRLDDPLTVRELLLELEQIALAANPVDGWDECDSEGCTNHTVWTLLRGLASGYERWLDDKSEALRLNYLALKVAEENASKVNDFELDFLNRRVLSELYDLEDYEGAEKLLNRLIERHLGSDRQSGFTRSNLITMSVMLDLQKNPDDSLALRRTIQFWSDDAFYPEEGVQNLIRFGNSLRRAGFLSPGRQALTAADEIYQQNPSLRRWDSLTNQLIRAHKSFDETERAAALLEIYKERVLAEQPRPREDSLWSRPDRRYSLAALARAYLSFDDLEGAVQILEMIGDSDARIRSNLYFAVASGFLRAKDVDRAKIYIELALGSLPDDEPESPDVYRYAASGNSAIALRMYVRLSLLLADNADSKEADHYFDHAYALAMARPSGPQRVWALAYLTTAMAMPEAEIASFLQTLDAPSPPIFPASLRRPFQ